MPLPNDLTQLGNQLTTAIEAFDAMDLQTVFTVIDAVTAIAEHPECPAGNQPALQAILVTFNGLFDGSAQVSAEDSSQFLQLAERLAAGDESFAIINSEDATKQDASDQPNSQPSSEMASGISPELSDILTAVTNLVDQGCERIEAFENGNNAQEAIEIRFIAESIAQQCVDQQLQPIKQTAIGISTLLAEPNEEDFDELLHLGFNHMLACCLALNKQEPLPAEPEELFKKITVGDQCRAEYHQIDQHPTSLTQLSQEEIEDAELIPSDQHAQTDESDQGLEAGDGNEGEVNDESELILDLNQDTDELTEFSNEVEENLDKSDEILLEIEGEGADKERIDGLFRAFHTIKGLAGFFNAHYVGKVAHETENLIDQARRQTIHKWSSYRCHL